MKEIQKIVLLTDETTSSVGRLFFKSLAIHLEEKGKNITILNIDLNQNVGKAIYQFDEIKRIQPDLLCVADFACIRMQSAEEQPMYVDMGIPTIHFLFKRPWEYEVFMIWRCDFTTRFYCLLEEDVPYIRTFYPRLLNISALDPALWNMDAKAVCYAMEGSWEELMQAYEELPAYMKTIAGIYEKIKNREMQTGDAQAMQMCLSEISFTCTAAEYMDILYMMRHVFALFYQKQTGIREYRMPQIDGEALKRQGEDFLSLDFPVTLLGT